MLRISKKPILLEPTQILACPDNQIHIDSPDYFAPYMGCRSVRQGLFRVNNHQQAHHEAIQLRHCCTFSKTDSWNYQAVLQRRDNLL